MASGEGLPLPTAPALGSGIPWLRREVFVTLKPKPHFDPEDDAHNVRKLTDRTIAFLSGGPGDKPFLCVLAHNTIHRPEMAPSAYLERFQSQLPQENEWIHPIQAAMVAELDNAFGRLMEALDQSGGGEDTIVVFYLRSRRLCRQRRSQTLARGQIRPLRGRASRALSDAVAQGAGKEGAYFREHRFPGRPASHIGGHDRDEGCRKWSWMG